MELSFMPSLLANCSWMGPHSDSCHDDITAPCKDIRQGCDDGKGGLDPGCNKCPTGMAYAGVETHPVDYDDWRHLVQATVQHSVDRYGLEEVKRWRFEVWNELWGFGESTPPCSRPPCIGKSYMSLYNASATAVKAVSSELRVGGPATEHLNTENFLSQAAALKAPVDFVSTHNYPTGPRGDGSGCPQGLDWVPDCFVTSVLEARGRIPSDMPFVISEYSVMVGQGMALAGRAGEPPFQHDSSGAAAFLFRVIPQLAPHLEVMSYWTFSDIFEENSIPRSEFFKAS